VAPPESTRRPLDWPDAGAQAFGKAAAGRLARASQLAARRRPSMSFSRVLWSLALMAPLVAGCGVPQPDELDDSDVELVPEGKEDNYLSTGASEYFAEGTARVVLEDSFAGKSARSRLVRAKELAQLKTLAIGWFLNVRLTDKEEGGGEHGDANAETYPGYHAIVRTGSWTIADVRPLADGKTFSFRVKLQVAGQKNLLQRLPGTTISGTRKRMTLMMGKLSNEDLARTNPTDGWFRDKQWESGTFDPTKLAADQLESIDLTFSTQPESSDAYLDLKRLIADGKLTIDAHYGHDYWARYDIDNAQDLYDQLVEQGFSAPKGWTTYRGQDGALTKTVEIGGQPVAVEVRIFHGAGKGTPGPDPETDEGGLEMERVMYESLAGSDVIIFSGHSGHYWGFALADWKKTDKGAVELPALMSAAMPADRPQIILASGCNTFSIAEALSNNPNKRELKNLNVITTNTFSDAASNEEVLELLEALYGGGLSRFQVRPVSTMLRKMNDDGMGAMYGLHGVDGNPKLHPFADLSTLGAACTTNDDCGGEGNRCTKVASKRVCSATCLGDGACPTGYRCRAVAATGSSTIVGKQCLR
jgi:hypothetical protein